MHSLCKWVFVHSEQSLRGRSLQLQPPIFHLPSKCDAHRQLRSVHWKLSFGNWLVEFCEVAPRRALLAHWWGNRYRVAKSHLSDDRVARCGGGHGDRGRSWEVTRVQQMATVHYNIETALHWKNSHLTNNTKYNVKIVSLLYHSWGLKYRNCSTEITTTSNILKITKLIHRIDKNS